jgi:hypothetical protein
MALQSFTITIGALTDAGNNGKNYVNNQPVYIKKTNGTLASIYRDLAGTSQIAQDGLSNVTNSKGQFTFFVEAGDYNAEYAGQITPITVVGADYFNSRIDETVNQIILDLSTSRGFRVKGTFAAGFTYELPNDVGLDASGNAWIYTDVEALPFTVPAATTPSAPTYTQVTFNQASNISYAENGNVEDALRKRAGYYTLAEAQASALEVGQYVRLTDRDNALHLIVLESDTGGVYIPLSAGLKLKVVLKDQKIFDTVQDFQSYPLPVEGNKYSTGAITWKVVSGSKGLLLANGLRAISLNGLWIDDFGCISDGAITSESEDGTRVVSGTDNSAPYKLAVDAFLDGAGKALVAGFGQYNFTESAILSYSGSASGLRGYKLTGQGGRNKSTYFMLVTEGVEKWFYQNGVTQRYQFQRVEGICFGSDSIANGNFYNAYGTGHEQGATFSDCRIEFVNKVNKASGTAGNSEYKWLCCKFTNIGDSVLELDNPQSVNHEYVSTEAETILGDVVRVSTGGGSVKWFGGSIILSTYGTIPDKLGAVVRNSTSGSGLGTGNQDFLFLGIKTELKTNQKKLYAGNNTGIVSIVVKFCDSNLTTTVGGARDAVTLNASQVVRLKNCELPQEFSYVVTGSSSSTAQNGLIEFEKCKDVSDLSSRCTVNNNYGAIRARELIFADTTGSGDSPNYATDFDVNFTNNGRGAYSSVAKTVSAIQNRLGWPYNGGNEQSVVLPEGAILNKITVYRPPSGLSSSQYTLKVGSNDKAVIYGQSTTDEQKNDHSFVVDNLMIDAGADANKRRVRVWADGGNALVQDVGFVIVEYY